MACLGIRILKAPQLIQSGQGTTDPDHSSSKMNIFILALSPELQVTYHKVCWTHPPHGRSTGIPNLPREKHYSYPYPTIKCLFQVKALPLFNFPRQGASDASRILCTALGFGMGDWTQAVLMWLLCLPGVVGNRILVEILRTHTLHWPLLATAS